MRRLTAAALARPQLVVVLWLLAALCALPGLLSLRFETTAGSLLNRSGPAWEFYRESLSLFGGDEIVVVALEAERPFDPVLLRDLAAICDEIEVLAGVRRVDSLSTVPIVRSLPDGTLRLDPALAGERLPTPAEAEGIRDIVALDRIAPRSLVSPDSRVFAINVLLDDSEGLDRVAVMDGIAAALKGRSGWVSGVPVFETRVGPRTQREISLFVPFTLALMGGLLFALFRSTWAVLVPLLSGALGTTLSLALMGSLGEPLTIVGILLPSVLLALGCAYAMHILTATRGMSGDAERARAVAEVAPAIALSGLTTAIGFFAIAIVDIDAIRALGAYGGVGVLAVLLAALTLAPALIQLRPLSADASSIDEAIRRGLAPRLVGFVERRGRGIISVWVAVVLAAGIGLSRVEVETDGTRWWPPGSQVRDDYEAIRERLSGISPMNVVLKAHGERSVIDPAVTERVDALARYLDGLPDVGKAVSLADPLRQIHGGFLGDPSNPLPKLEAMNAQYLLLLESVEHVKDLVTEDRSAANVLLRVDNNGSAHLLEVARAAEGWWEESGLEDVTARVTGIMFEFARSEDAIARGQLQGLCLALLAIGIILIALFRTPLVAAIATLPNALPLVAIFGGMGLAGIPLDAGTACLGSLALGIAVDDTIHVMLGYREFQGPTTNTAAALRLTYRRVLPALVYTTVIVGVGFGVLGFSEFTLTRNLGWVTSVLVALCLLADVTLLPALLLRVGGGRMSQNMRV